jgi:hypothetical protein
MLVMAPTNKNVNVVLKIVVRGFVRCHVQGDRFTLKNSHSVNYPKKLKNGTSSH